MIVLGKKQEVGLIDSKTGYSNILKMNNQFEFNSVLNPKKSIHGDSKDVDESIFPPKKIISQKSLNLLKEDFIKSFVGEYSLEEILDN